MKPLTNLAAERAVLSGLCQYGYNEYIELAGVVDEDCFTSSTNKLIYKCIEHSFDTDASKSIDTASIFSSAANLGLTEIMTDKSYNDHIVSLFNFYIEQHNVKKHAVKIKKLSITRKLREKLSSIQDSLLNIEGSEPISEIISIGETGIFEFTSSLNNSDSDPVLINHELRSRIEYRMANPVDQIGISTGMPYWDRAIGGGLRPGTVNMISARPKVGKSLLSSNMGYYIANTQKIPVLNLDTEMTREDHQNRMLAMVSECFIYDVETGKFVQKPAEERRVREALDHLDNTHIPYYHKSISGVSFEEQLSIIRRWIVKVVGLDSEGHAKPCVLIYDYLKLMTGDNISSAMNEFQLLGFMLTELHNLSVKYMFPTLCFSQLNRDGISNESTDVVAGSDRIIWFCSNFTIFKEKSEEEIALDGAEEGNRKLVPLIQRHGAGLQTGDYINCYMNGNIAKIVEGRTKFELLQQRAARELEQTDNE